LKHLSKPAKKIFDNIIDQLNGPEKFHPDETENYIKIDNTAGSFMPLVVERLYKQSIGTVYSFAHYFKQNGDMCQDPEMLFILHENGNVYPKMFQQYPNFYEESIFWDDGWKVHPKMQADHTKFANMWLKNIKEQQKL